MTFNEFYNKKIVGSIKESSAKEQNKIFVILGQVELLNDHWLTSKLSDPSSFYISANHEIFDKEWFSNIFLKLNTKQDLHVVSYAQFSYIINYIDESFFKDRAIIIKDNSRLLFPLENQYFIENSQSENIEARSEKMPIYQAEQYQLSDEFYYSVRLPNEGFQIKEVFSDKAPLIIDANSNNEIVDLTSDNLALDIFLNECIKNNALNRVASVKTYSKQPISNALLESLLIVNSILNEFGGGLHEFKETSISESFQPSPDTLNLLKKYWGNNAQFRSLKVYKNPDSGNDIIEISQGLIVETIIKEYNNSVSNHNSRDLFLTAPTGAGKSLLFQLPSFYVSDKGDITIVVSPLIALMKDQVNAIISERQFDKVAYLNSELSLVDRERIIENCHSGDVDLLYMSPELLMSYDISHFIGNRKLGLVVIDEAHLITTWGRDFRVDYWFLGNHIRKIRKYHNMSFPMVAVTATAIYGGANDMVFDSIDSLVMRNPHVYIGQVKREDVNFAINNYEKFEKNYEKSKLNQTINFIKGINKTGLKTLVYAPYTKHIRQALDGLRAENLDIASGYYGSLPAEQKELAFREFKSGAKKIMISTKAFGMGVDISDIEVVYHHAPSGLLPDYVQEIGRVARKPEIQGYAALNYTSQDQRFTKALHGMSALRQYQLKEVLKKIHKAYLKNKKSRNLLLSVDDFGHIFENAIDLDQKVLTALMMIEKDYLAKSRFNVIVARPKKLFVKVFARVTDEGYLHYNKSYPGTSKVLFSQKNGQKIIEVSLDDLWYNHFSDKSFPVVKHDFYSGYLFRHQNIEVIPQLKISFERTTEYNTINSVLTNLFNQLKSIFVEFNGAFFTEEQFIQSINIYIKDRLQSEKIGQFILSSYSGRLIQPGVIENDAFLQHRRDTDGYKYRIYNNKYLSSFTSLIKRLHNIFGESTEVLANRFVTNKASNSVNYVRLGYFLEMLELGTFEIKGGENPMVFIRINDPNRIEKDANSEFYSNTLLSKTLDRHHLSNQIFDHFFLRSFSNSERWDFIEDFFLGMDIDILLDKYKGGESNNLNVVEYLEKNAQALNSPVTRDESRTNIHIFHPKKDQFYRSADLLTIESAEGFETKNVSEWLTDNPVLFDMTRKKHDMKIDKTVFEILVSRLRANHVDYFKKSLGLNFRIEFKGYPGLVKAIVPFKDQPLSFYKWWTENPDEIYMDFRSKIELINKVYSINPKVLTSEHRKIINR